MSFNYLGVNIGDNHRKKDFWEEIVAKIGKRLARRKGKFVSLAGRECVIKSFLSTMSLFLLSLFKLPQAIRLQIIRLQRDFLWGWGHENRKITWVSWEKNLQKQE